GNIQIGDVSATPSVNASYTNIFDNLLIGVLGGGSKTVLYNNYFQNLSYIPAADNSTLSAGFLNTANYCTVGSGISGPTGVPFANTFTNCVNGIYCTGNGTIAISN